MFVSGSGPPIPQFRLLLDLPDLFSDSTSTTENFFQEPGYFSSWPGFVETFRPRLGGSPPAPGGSERAPPEPGGFMLSREKLCTRYRIPWKIEGIWEHVVLAEIGPTFGMDS